MIIGIYGKANSGKDVLGTIIQYLTSELDDEYNFYEWLAIKELNTHETIYTKFDIIKFATPIKKIIANLLNIDVDDLENREYKESVLDSKWQHYRTENNPLTVRELLTTIGTDLGRNKFYPDIWIDNIFNDYNKYKKWIITDIRFNNELNKIKEINQKENKGFTIKIHRDKNNYFKPVYNDKVWVKIFGFKKWILGSVVNCKNKSEYKIQLNVNGIKFKTTVNYNNILPYEADPNFINGPENSLDYLDDSNFDYVIDNNGTISDLINNIKNILKNEKLYNKRQK